MTIEFTNATPAKQGSALSNLLLGVSFVFLFAPITLIVLGYYKNLPTGSLVSPIPTGVVSQQTPTTITQNQAPIIANPAENTTPNSSQTGSNSQEKVATIAANTSETIITDPDILETSQIYLTNQTGDKSLYSVKSKSTGQFTIVSNSTTSENRQIDYHIVNP